MTNWLFGEDTLGYTSKSILDASLHVMGEAYVGTYEAIDSIMSSDIIVSRIANMLAEKIIKHKFINTNIPMFYLKIRFSKSKWVTYNAVKHTYAFRKYMTIGPRYLER
jgi:hypothetical protein